VEAHPEVKYQVRGSPLNRQAWSTSYYAFVSYIADRQTDGRTHTRTSYYNTCSSSTQKRAGKYNRFFSNRTSLACSVAPRDSGRRRYCFWTHGSTASVSVRSLKICHKACSNRNCAPLPSVVYGCEVTNDRCAATGDQKVTEKLLPVRGMICDRLIFMHVLFFIHFMM